MAGQCLTPLPLPSLPSSSPLLSIESARLCLLTTEYRLQGQEPSYRSTLSSWNYWPAAATTYTPVTNPTTTAITTDATTTNTATLS